MGFIEEKIACEALTFDDVLLIPSYSDVHPREVNISSRFSRNIKLDTPIASAAMDTVTEQDMALAMSEMGGIGVIHKNMAPDAQAAMVAAVKAAGGKVAAAVGIGEQGLDRIEALSKAGVDAVVLDCAHGHSKSVFDKLAAIKAAYPSLDVVVGNIATAQAAQDLIAAGADALKVGIGPGSICTTRIVAGVGVPQLTAIWDVYSVAREAGIPVIADGGIRYSGDIVKALAAGADCVMCGGMLAGTTQAPGKIVLNGGKQYKEYRGMGSLDAMRDGSADRYFQQGAKKLVPEGIVGCVAFKGDAKDIIYQLVGGLRSGMGYCGAADMDTLHRTAKFTRISASGMAESHPHDITITKEAPNYHV